VTMIESVGWVLLHFVWQGVAIAGTLAVLLALTSTARATLRYALSCGALTAMLVAALATTATIIPQSTRTTERLTDRAAQPTSEITAMRGMPSPTTASRLFDRAQGKPEPVVLRLPKVWNWVEPLVNTALPWLVGVWAVGVLLLSVRLVGGWWRTRSIRVEGTAAVPEWCQSRLTEIRERLGVTRAVSVVSSVRLHVPVVLGHLRPVIVLPAAVLAGLSPSQIDAILAHELAHVRRHDYLVNLIQTVVETLLFYHPAVWWVSSQVRETREHCCDDLAVTVCTSRKGYVSALLGLEELRMEQLKPAGVLALGATDGSLLARARRLLRQPEREGRTPRLAASAIALSILATAVGGASLGSEPPVLLNAAAAEPMSAGADSREGTALPAASIAQPAQQVPPSSIVVAPEANASLANRWTWAERAARDARRTRYWIGYEIAPARSLPPVIYMDQASLIMGESMTFRGHIMSRDASGLRFPGRRLVVPGGDSSVKLLFAFDTTRGTPALTAVHGSSMPLPVDTKDLAIYWLGAAAADQSIERIDRLYRGASTLTLQNDLIAAIGVHDASEAVVTWLEQRVASGDADTLRANAAERIAWHPIQRSVAALDRIARNDRSSKVRQEAAEGMGDLAIPEAAPALIALARELDDRIARREAVEALGGRTEPAAASALESIAKQDADIEIQREAVETLGDLSDDRGTPALLELARTHPQVDVKREAIETLGDREPTEAIINQLKEFATQDGEPGVQEEAIETLAGLNHPGVRPALTELARTHPRMNVRREAIESLADHASHEQGGAGAKKAILDLLTALATEERDIEVQIEAVESLGEMTDGAAVERLRDLARTHQDERIRVEAVETLGEHDDARDIAQFLKTVALNEKSQRVRDEAIETLGELKDGAGVDALVGIAREHSDTNAQRRALQALLDNEHPRARQALKLQKR
jgi:beta-lactamase regulating signal transducer with metallopeptidase domain/HEAT repeat protein